MAFNPVTVLLRATQIVRRWDITVTFEPGWETRGNGYRSAWVGILNHHTGTPTSLRNPFPTRRLLREGRSDLSGPLCNTAGPADGSIHVMAAQAANHAGASGGRSMGSLPTSSLFNPKVLGHEIDYAGSAPMQLGQYRAAVLWSRAVLLALVEAGQITRFDTERVRLHYETSITGKWDAGYAPGKPIDAAALRRAISASPVPLKTEEDDMPSLDELLSTKLGTDGNTAFEKWASKPGTLGHWLRGQRQLAAGTRAMVTAQAATIDKLADLLAAGDNNLTAEGVKAAVAQAIAEGTVKVNIDVTGVQS